MAKKPEKFEIKKKKKEGRDYNVSTFSFALDKKEARPITGKTSRKQMQNQRVCLNVTSLTISSPGTLSILCLNSIISFKALSAS